MNYIVGIDKFLIFVSTFFQMATKQDVIDFLSDFHQKRHIWSILFRNDRGKNTQALADLEITPSYRNKVIADLKIENYSEGPLKDNLNKGPEMWVFGKTVKGVEIYIKITMGLPGSHVVCFSFHQAEHPIQYPLKNS